MCQDGENKWSQPVAHLASLTVVLHALFPSDSA